MNNIEIRLLSNAEKLLALKFMHKTIEKNGTTLMKWLNISSDEAGILASKRINDCLENQDRLCSFIAMDRDKDRIVGCAIRKLCPRYPEISKFSQSIQQKEKTDKLQIFFHFNRLIWNEAEQFIPNNYTGLYLRSDLSLVDPNYRRFGVWRQMLDIGLKYVYEKFSCKYAIGSCTTIKTQVHCEREGWRTLRRIDYDDFYVNGKRVFEGREDHEVCAKLMMVDIEQWLVNKQ